MQLRLQDALHCFQDWTRDGGRQQGSRLRNAALEAGP